jgi:hypothetical protein
MIKNCLYTNADSLGQWHKWIDSKQTNIPKLKTNKYIAMWIYQTKI